MSKYIHGVRQMFTMAVLWEGWCGEESVCVCEKERQVEVGAMPEYIYEHKLWCFKYINIGGVCNTLSGYHFM